MKPESTTDFILRMHGMGADQPQIETPDSKSDPLGYILNAAKVTQNDLYQGLLTNQPAQNWRQSVYRGIPSGVGATIGGIVGGAAGGASSMGLGTVPGAYAGMGAGGAGGEFVRQGLVGLNAALGNTEAPTMGQVAFGGAKEGAINALVPMAAKPLFRAAGKTITGITGSAMDRLLERPSEVATQAMLNPDAAPTLAKQFINAIEGNMDRAGEAYRNLINTVVGKNPKYGPDFTINMKDALVDTVGDIRKDFGYGLPGRLAEQGDAQLFNKFANGLNKMGSATAEEAYYFQRDLTNAIRNNSGKPIAAALGRLKSGVMDTLEQHIPEIGQANAIYKGANELGDELSRVTNADNALGVIKSALKNKGNTFDALGQAADQIAGARGFLEATKDAMAGAEFSPTISNLPRTGFTAGLGVLGYKAGLESNPMAQAAAVGVAPFLSPQAVAYGARATMSTPGQLAIRPAISGGLDQLLQAAGIQSESKKIEPESTTDFILRLHGMK